VTADSFGGEFKPGDKIPGSEKAATGNGCGVAFMPSQMTHAMRAGLRARGYADDQIQEMTPGEAWKILGPPAADQSTPTSAVASQPTPAPAPAPTPTPGVRASTSGSGDKLALKIGWATSELEDSDAVVEGLVHRNSITLIYGPPKSGKSFFATALLMAIAAGDIEFMGHDIVEAGLPALYVSLEGHNGFPKRLKAIAKDRGWTEETFPKNWALARGQACLIEMRGRARGVFVARPDDILAKIKEMKAAGLTPAVICIDTVFRSISPGNVSQPDHMGAYIEALGTIAAMRIAVVAVHHEIKRGGTYTGSVALGGAADNIIHTERLDGTLRSFEVEAAKDDAECEPRTFELEVMDIGLSRRGRPLTSCIVRNRGATPVGARKRKKMDSLERAYLEAYDRLADGAATSKGHKGEDVKKVSVDAIREALKQNGRLELENGKLPHRERNRLSRAKTALMDAGWVVENNGLLWRIKTS
jgi:hypothetical protein